eukprot:CAMPEP_0116833724 /NCGR_PEP_ID=MMETSP0418-20121206/6597_1 /TAXON_ID=1158023 /ORGANISM="Astrosyne radiata, Strain 13vi08-1A" /LENGTH=321 /DNA_ID=CAMNT_0004463209 /DNA_START=114 /DNA_END=1079 /DNA_ORIENTATION=-
MVDIARVVSEAWKNLMPQDRQIWEEKARLDKRRYEIEKQTHNNSHRRRKRKDPLAPKKPMSAYLSFANSKRLVVKAMNPQASNAQVSRILASMWREAPRDLKQKYIDNEARLRQQYKVDIAAWRLNRDLTTGVKQPGRLEQASEITQEAIGYPVAVPFAAMPYNRSNGDSDVDSLSGSQQEASFSSGFCSNASFFPGVNIPEDNMEPIALSDCCSLSSDGLDIEGSDNVASFFTSLEERNAKPLSSPRNHPISYEKQCNGQASPPILNFSTTASSTMMEGTHEFAILLDNFLQDTLSDDTGVINNDPLCVDDFPLEDLFDE